MSINKTTPSPLALREGFHVVLLRALAERLQGRDWVLKGGTNLRLYFGSIRFSEDIDLDVGKDVAGAMQHPAQREQLQDEDTWIARQLFVVDLIDQILAVPPETIT
jgi:predicted nucleotidyltransferase component of viral defense system